MSNRRTIKRALQNIEAEIAEIAKKVSDIFLDLDFDEVAGNSVHRYSRLALELSELSHTLEASRTKAGQIARYQSRSSIVYTPRVGQR